MARLVARHCFDIKEDLRIMDILTLLAVFGLVLLALGIGYLLGRWLSARKSQSKLFTTMRQYEIQRHEFSKNQEAYTKSQSDFKEFRKASIKEYSKLKNALEASQKDLKNTKSELLRAQSVKPAEAKIDPQTDPSSKEFKERRGGTRRANEQATENLADELLSTKMEQATTEKQQSNTAHLDTAQLGEDFFEAGMQPENNESTNFFASTSFGEENSEKHEEQKALLVEYIERTQKQESRISELITENLSIGSGGVYKR